MFSKRNLFTLSSAACCVCMQSSVMPDWMTNATSTGGEVAFDPDRPFDLVLYSSMIHDVTSQHKAGAVPHNLRECTHSVESHSAKFHTTTVYCICNGTSVQSLQCSVFREVMNQQHRKAEAVPCNLCEQVEHAGAPIYSTRIGRSTREISLHPPKAANSNQLVLPISHAYAFQ